MTFRSAAAIIRDARLGAALTQVQLANIAGVAQSVISAYESGHREPSLGVLRRLVAATGLELELDLIPARNRTALSSAVELHRLELRRALMRLGAKNVRVFGSVARGDDRPDSDVDLLVDIEASVGLFALGKMRSEAERILGSTVDIVPANSLRPDVAERALMEAVSL